MSSLLKYKIREVAKDFDMPSKVVTALVTEYFEAPRSTAQVLTDEQLNVIFDRITRDNQIESIEEVFATALTAQNSEPEKPAEKEIPAETESEQVQKPQTQAQKPQGQSQKPQTQAQKPQAQGGKPQQLRSLLDAGFYVSFGFCHNDESLRACPADRLLLETDDDRQHPIAALYRIVAEKRGLTVAALCQSMAENYRTFFRNEPLRA